MMNERGVKRLSRELAYFDPAACCSVSSVWCSPRAGQNLVELNLVSTGAWSPQSLSWLVRRPELIPAATPEPTGGPKFRHGTTDDTQATTTNA